MGQIINCLKCGSEMENLGGSAYACIFCDMPGEPERRYEDVCWNCGKKIDSKYCNKSLTPGMSYHCKYCGHDLTGWKIRKGIIKPGDSHAAIL